MFEFVPRPSTAHRRDAAVAQAERERSSDTLNREFRQALERQRTGTDAAARQATSPSGGEASASRRASWTSDTSRPPPGDVRRTAGEIRPGTQNASGSARPGEGRPAEQPARLAGDEVSARHDKAGADAPIAERLATAQQERSTSRAADRLIDDGAEGVEASESMLSSEPVESADKLHPTVRRRHDEAGDRDDGGGAAAIDPGTVAVPAEGHGPTGAADAADGQAASSGTEAGLAHRSAELMMSEFRRLGFLCDRRSWQFTLDDDAAFVVDMDLERTADGEWTLRLGLPSGRQGHDAATVADELRTRLATFDLTVHVRIEEVLR